MFYFSYGSNMSTKRLQSRVPSAQAICVATLPEHKLSWHKRSSDGSAKCDAEFTGDKQHAVIGVVFEILISEKATLDKCEGLGCGYEEKTISLLNETGNEISALTYYATDIDQSLKAYHWYKEHVLRGAREHKLNNEYISTLEEAKSIHDDNTERHERELIIYTIDNSDT